MRKAKYVKIRITGNQERIDADSLTLDECGVKVDETYYADVFIGSSRCWIRAKRDNADKSIIAGDTLSVEPSEYEVAE
ncbi:MULTISPECIES: hypothetical protein [Gammaproteobacteria]|uniref:hypothetical protein n=1 Tax=Gammaproteobacteria TaxID=1236 RepID=UPI002FC6AE31